MATSDVLIDLKITKTEDATTGKFLLTVKVERYQNIQAEIFVFERVLNTGDDYFSHVANTAELTTLPKHTPQSGNIYFLEHTIETEYDTAMLREDTLAMILTDVERLRADWDIVREQINGEYRVVIS